MTTDSGLAAARLAAELGRVAQGNRAALHLVYQSSSAKLFGICLLILQDRPLSEDVLQEVYLKVWQGAGGFDSRRGSAMTWLCTLARNTAIDWRRATQRRAAASAAMRDEAPPQPLGDWQRAKAARAQSTELHACLQTLPDQAQSSIRSAFFDGHSYSELADLARVPLGTMKSWIRRGLQQLRECLDHG
jgi:RNA polymerase sigma factor (sigma-70 family)